MELGRLRVDEEGRVTPVNAHARNPEIFSLDAEQCACPSRPFFCWSCLRSYKDEFFLEFGHPYAHKDEIFPNILCFAFPTSILLDVLPQCRTHTMPHVCCHFLHVRYFRCVFVVMAQKYMSQHIHRHFVAEYVIQFASYLRR